MKLPRIVWKETSQDQDTDKIIYSSVIIIIGLAILIIPTIIAILLILLGIFLITRSEKFKAYAKKANKQIKLGDAI